LPVGQVAEQARAEVILLAKPCEANTRAAVIKREPETASLHKVVVASLPKKMKPEPMTKQWARAVVGLLGVKGGSARGKIGRGTWEAHRSENGHRE
jgi:hypothetical protein